MQVENLQEHQYSHVSKEDLDYLKQLVNIPSQSKNIAGVNEVQALYNERLTSLGMKSIFVENDFTHSGDLLIARTAGKSSFTLTTIGHADTVLAPGKDLSFKYVDKGRKITGAGIADNKSGILVAMKGIEYFLKNCDEQLLSLQFVSSPNEELGSTGFHELFHQLGKESDFVLGFEPSLECGSLIHSRNGNRWYRLEVEGKTYHSGRAHKGHMNAAHDLCKKIENFFNLVALHEDITMNVGMIEGGHSYNTICEKITAKIDTRFTSFDGLDKIKDIFESCHNHLKYPCSKTNEISTTMITVDDFCPPLAENIQSKFYLQKYRKFIESIEGRVCESVHCGGAADVNHFSHPEVIAFDGLGAIGGNMHRKDEYIQTASLTTRSLAFGKFLLELNESLKGLP